MCFEFLKIFYRPLKSLKTHPGKSRATLHPVPSSLKESEHTKRSGRAKWWNGIEP